VAVSGGGSGGGSSWALFDLERMLKKNRLITQSLISDLQQRSTETTTATYYYNGPLELVITDDTHNHLDQLLIYY